MIVEDKSEPEKPVDREKVSIILVFMTKHLTYMYLQQEVSERTNPLTLQLDSTSTSSIMVFGNISLTSRDYVQEE
jgi:hypothetical protein